MERIGKPPLISLWVSVLDADSTLQHTWFNLEHILLSGCSAVTSQLGYYDAVRKHLIILWLGLPY